MNMVKAIALFLAILFNIQVAESGLYNGYRFDVKEAQSHFVDYHNTARRQVADPEAANMRKLVWNDEVAERCFNATKSCPAIPYDDPDETTNITVAGYNLFWTYGYEFETPMATSAMKAWDTKLLNCEDDDRKCLQYARMIWARNDKIGCSAVACTFLSETKGTRGGVLICCAYEPEEVISKDQFADTKNIFKPGDACSQCDENMVCEDKLCIPCDGPNANSSACVTPKSETTPKMLSTTGVQAHVNTTAGPVTDGAGTAVPETAAPTSATTSGCKSYVLSVNAVNFILAIVLLISLFMEEY